MPGRPHPVLGEKHNTDIIHGGLSQSTVVIMVGGYGRRLFPLTESLPKPLLPVAGVPVLKRILDCLVLQGVQRVVLCAHFQADKMTAFAEAYRAENGLTPLTLDIVTENEPTGTAGALRLLSSEYTDQPLIVTNGDVLTELDYATFLAQHRQAGNAITVASRYYQQTIPYGVLSLTPEGTIESVQEKPSRALPINCGTYVLSPTVLGLMPKQGRVDMTDLIHRALETRQRVGTYIFDDYWLDIGQPADYEKANQDFLMNKSLTGSPASPIRWLQAVAPQTPRRACSE